MDDILRIAGLVEESVVDGPGIRFVVFVQGCPHNCFECHNPQTHDPNGGYDLHIDQIIDKITKNPLIDGVTLSGGEPFCQPKALYSLAKKLKNLNYNILAYSGYTLDELLNIAKHNQDVKNLLSYVDTLIDGRFISSLKDYNLSFRGSSNQNIINMHDIDI